MQGPGNQATGWPESHLPCSQLLVGHTMVGLWEPANSGGWASGVLPVVGSKGIRGSSSAPPPAPAEGQSCTAQLLGSEGGTAANQRFLEDHPPCPSYFGSPSLLPPSPGPHRGADCPTRTGHCATAGLAPSTSRAQRQGTSSRANSKTGT